MFIVRVGAEPLSSNSRLLLVVSVSCLAAGIVLFGTGVRCQLRTGNVVDPVDPLCGLADSSKAAAQAPRRTSACSYQAEDIKKMLDVQRPYVFPPSTTLDRLLNQLFEKIEHSSPELQKTARVYFAQAFSAAVSLCMFFLLGLSIFLGIFGSQSTAVIGWTAVAYFYCLSIYSIKRAPSEIAWLVGIAVMLPVIVAGANARYPLPAVHNSVFVFMILPFLLPGAQFGIFSTSFDNGCIRCLRSIAAREEKFGFSIHFILSLYFNTSRLLWIADVLRTFQIGVIYILEAAVIPRELRQVPSLGRCYWRLTRDYSLTLDLTLAL